MKKFLAEIILHYDGCWGCPFAKADSRHLGEYYCVYDECDYHVIGSAYDDRPPWCPLKEIKEET